MIQQIPLARFSGDHSLGGTSELRELNTVPTLRRTWASHRHLEFYFRFQIAAFQNARDSNATEVENRRQISNLLTPCKITGGIGKVSASVFLYET